MAKQEEQKKAIPTENMPCYTIDELASAPEAVGAKSPDIVRAAMKTAGKESVTVKEATEIIKKFKNKEVK